MTDTGFRPQVVRTGSGGVWRDAGGFLIWSNAGDFLNWDAFGFLAWSDAGDFHVMAS